MSIPISQKVDLLYKQAFGVTKTDTESNKSPSNEAIASPLLNRGAPGAAHWSHGRRGR